MGRFYAAWRARDKNSNAYSSRRSGAASCATGTPRSRRVQPAGHRQSPDERGRRPVAAPRTLGPLAPALIEIVDSQSICVRDERELDRQVVELDAELVEEAQHQLLTREGDRAGSCFRAGYLLGVDGEAAATSMPAASALKR